MKYMKQSIDELRSKVNLVEVIEEHIDLKKSGAAYKALCPFHDERSPSFTIQKGDSHYHCFGCGAHGDAIGFLMLYNHMGFIDAVEHLAERFHVRLEKADAREDDAISRTVLKAILDKATTFYHYMLVATQVGQDARNYLAARAIPDDFIKTFRIGFAPSGNVLVTYLKSLGFSYEAIDAAGLLSKRRGDFFSERITFPIQDPQGAVIGFSARKIKEETFGGKYINTAETVLFKKSKLLFGLAQSRRRIIKGRAALIVEGQLDALRLIYNGFDFTVAGGGTAFGEDHVAELIRFGIDTAYLFFDSDTAGAAATVKVGNLFQKEGVEVKVVVAPPGHDPDSMLKNFGPLHVYEKLLEASDFLYFLFHHFAKGKNLASPAEKNHVVQEISTMIHQWQNPVMVHESLKKLASIAAVPEDVVGVGSRRPPPIFVSKLEATKQGVDPDRILESDLIRLFLAVDKEKKQELVELAKKNLKLDSFRVPVAAKLFSYVSGHDMEEGIDFFSIAAHVEDEELDSFIALLLSRKAQVEKAGVLAQETIKRMKERNWMHACEELHALIQSGSLSQEEVIKQLKLFNELKRTPPVLV